MSSLTCDNAPQCWVICQGNAYSDWIISALYGDYGKSGSKRNNISKFWSLRRPVCVDKSQECTDVGWRVRPQMAAGNLPLGKKDPCRPTWTCSNNVAIMTREVAEAAEIKVGSSLLALLFRTSNLSSMLCNFIARSRLFPTECLVRYRIGWSNAAYFALVNHSNEPPLTVLFGKTA